MNLLSARDDDAFKLCVGAFCIASTPCMPDACSTALAALEACKRELGLLPKQCYPRSGYNGQCDKAEFELKRCRAYDANPRDAAVLYNTKADRKARVEANARLQKKLQRHHFECTP